MSGLHRIVAISQKGLYNVCSPCSGTSVHRPCWGVDRRVAVHSDYVICPGAIPTAVQCDICCWGWLCLSERGSGGMGIRVYRARHSPGLQGAQLLSIHWDCLVVPHYLGCHTPFLRDANLAMDANIVSRLCGFRCGDCTLVFISCTVSI